LVNNKNHRRSIYIEEIIDEWIGGFFVESSKKEFCHLLGQFPIPSDPSEAEAS
jgi:hypothetical protein